MAIIILAAFILVPLAEIAVFIEIGSEIGALWTIAICLATAIAGSWLLRIQGLATLARVRQQMDRGVPPTRELFDGALLLLAGAMLLVPGFVTDAAGFLLYLPPVRGFLFGQVTARSSVAFHMAMEQEQRRRGPAGDGQGPIIDGEYEDLDAAGDQDRKGRGDKGPDNGTRRLPE